MRRHPIVKQCHPTHENHACVALLQGHAVVCVADGAGQDLMLRHGPGGDGPTAAGRAVPHIMKDDLGRQRPSGLGSGFWNAGS